MAAILGISAFYHDSAACVVTDEGIVAAAQEERFTRCKHDSRFPRQAVAYCLKESGLRLHEIDAVVFHESPPLKFDRLLETWVAFAPRGLKSFQLGMRSWLGWKLSVREIIERELHALSSGAKRPLPDILCTTHHASHAASAFYPSGLRRAAVLCLDGVGEWATTTTWAGEGSALRLLAEIPFPHSLGLLYSAFTFHAGFRVNSAEYKLMGLAPYGEPSYVTAIRDCLIDLKDDGSFRLNLEYFDYCIGTKMTNDKFCALFGGNPRVPESRITRRELDLARSIQAVIEDVVVRLASTLRRDTGLPSLCIAGGVALNCVANTHVLHNAGFERVWVQPAAGDAGCALGAALLGLVERRGSLVHGCDGDAMSGALLGPSFSEDEIRSYLKGVGARFKVIPDEEVLLDQTVDSLVAGQVVGWFQGRAEFGPRALGARSILADPRDPEMQRRLNRKVKFRESFRPFAPSVLLERAPEYFETDRPSPYMQFVAKTRQTTTRPEVEEPPAEDLLARLSLPRSDIPAVTHVDGTARLQTVGSEANPLFVRLLRRFATRTGCAVLINTSFNVRGEPIVLTPEDAYRCFMHTDMDLLVMGNSLLKKLDQVAMVKDNERLGSRAMTAARYVDNERQIVRLSSSTQQARFLHRLRSRMAAGALACALAGMFVGVMAPAGWWRRLCGRDRVRAPRDPKCRSYWEHPAEGAVILAGVRPLARPVSELANLRKGRNAWIARLFAVLEPLARSEPQETELPLAIYTMF